jgi:hypothetical protein
MLAGFPAPRGRRGGRTAAAGRPCRSLGRAEAELPGMGPLGTGLTLVRGSRAGEQGKRGDGSGPGNGAIDSVSRGGNRVCGGGGR